jgi:tripartite-type tricarboxylate transporter receptor subunit TctC
MKRIAVSAACIAAVWVSSPGALAQSSYPVKPIKTVSTVSGGMATVARIVAQGLSQSLGQPVIVEAQPGAGGSIGQETVMRAAPDGYTLLMSVAATHVTHGFLSRHSRFDPVASYAPLAKIAESVLVAVVNSAVPVASMAELIEYARRNPGKVSYGTNGIGTAGHFSAVAVSRLSGIEWVHVPYKTGAAFLADVVAGEIQLGWGILSTAAPFMKSGKLRVIAINAAKRHEGTPDIPTITEHLRGYEPPPTWGAYFGPAGLPQPIVARLNREIVAAVKAPESRRAIDASGSIVSTSTPEELDAMVRRDVAYFARAVEASGIKPE